MVKAAGPCVARGMSFDFGRREVVRIVVRWVRANGGRWLLGVFGWMGLAGDGEAEVEGVEDAEEGVNAGVAFAGEGAVEGLAS